MHQEADPPKEEYPSSRVFYLRSATKEDDYNLFVPVIHEAFATFERKSGLPDPDLSREQSCLECVVSLLDSEVVLAIDKASEKIIGYNALDNEAEDKAAIGVGPLAVSPSWEGKGVGKQLMKYVMQKAVELGFKSTRLVVNAHDPSAFALYASVGYETKLPLALVSGLLSTKWNDNYQPPKVALSNLTLSKMTIDDVEECCRLSVKVTGFSRSKELTCCIKADMDNNNENENAKAYSFVPYVMREEGQGRIVAYTSGLNSIGHTVAESNEYGKQLLVFVSALARDGSALTMSERLRLTITGEANGIADYLPTFFVPLVTHASLLRWCLAGGLRVMKNMNLMVHGEYREITEGSCYLPSILY
jgi:predicted N-acetyltransferase YhbS